MRKELLLDLGRLKVTNLELVVGLAEDAPIASFSQVKGSIPSYGAYAQAIQHLQPIDFLQQCDCESSKNKRRGIVDFDGRVFRITKIYYGMPEAGVYKETKEELSWQEYLDLGCPKWIKVEEKIRPSRGSKK